MSIISFLNYISLEKNGSTHTTKAYQKNLEAFKNFLSSLDSAIRIENVSYNEIRTWIVFLITKAFMNVDRKQSITIGP